MWWRGSLAAAAAVSLACMSSVLPAEAQSQPDQSLSATPSAPAFSQGSVTEALAFGPAADTDNPFGNVTFDKRWFDNLGPLPGTVSQASSWDSSAALGYAHAPTASSIPSGPTSLPAESGVNYTLSPFAGYLNLGSGLGSQAIGGTSGTLAFPIGQSFGLISNFTAASIGGNALYQGGTNLYWRDPGLGLIGATAELGYFNNFGGANYGSGGANFEDYFGRFTPYASVGAFNVQTMKTKGYGTIGMAYYPTDNLQLSLGGYDYGGVAGAQGGVEYLLPQKVNGVATTVSVNGYVGNKGTSGAMARMNFLFGPTSVNNKTLIERRRQDDPDLGFTTDTGAFIAGALTKFGTSRQSNVGTINYCKSGQDIDTNCICPSGDIFPPNLPTFPKEHCSCAGTICQ